MNSRMIVIAKCLFTVFGLFPKKSSTVNGEIPILGNITGKLKSGMLQRQNTSGSIKFAAVSFFIDILHPIYYTVLA